MSDRVESKIILDTNVVMEILAVKDLLDSGEKLGTEEAALGSPVFRYRQLRSRHANLLVWLFAKQRINTGSLKNEVVDILRDKMAPQSDGNSYGFTTVIVHVVRPRMLHGWGFGALIHANPLATKEDADDELLRLALAHGDAIITNEGLSPDGYSDVKKNGDINLRGKCHRDGVPVFSPAEYLIRLGADVPVEARKFCDAYEKAAREALRSKTFANPNMNEFLDTLDGLYRFIMRDEVDQRFEHIKRPTVSERARS